MLTRRTTLKRWLFRLLFFCLLIGIVAIALTLWNHPSSILRYLAKFVALLFLIPMLPVLLFRWIPPPTSAFMLMAQMQLKRRGRGNIVYQWVNLREIAPEMCLAAIVAEDPLFPTHLGVDRKSLQAAYAFNRQAKNGQPRRGGSTISQQLVKNLFLWSTRSYLRKAVELFITLLVEGVWPKRRILEVYLNIVQFGEHIFGVESAARYFFGKQAIALAPQECALLAAVLPNPKIYQVSQPSPEIRFRQAIILSDMKKISPQKCAYFRQLGLVHCESNTRHSF